LAKAEQAEENHWPGFVDALSTIVMVVTFLLIILAIAIFVLSLKIVDVTDGDWQAAGVMVHNAKNRSLAHMLVEMPFGPFPMALGVIYDDPRPSYEAAVAEERQKAVAGKTANLAKLLGKGQTWTVEEKDAAHGLMD